jgi:hypothetical protein
MMQKSQYKIEHKVLTLAHCAVMENKEKPASFSIDGVSFSHWDFNYSDGWLTDAWIAEIVIDAESSHNAFQIFREKLTRIIPRIALISQSYTEFINEPFLITKTGTDIAFFRYTKDVGSVGLMFMEEGKKALGILLEDHSIPEAFYYYWNDAVNTIGYSPKLLLMFSALEALVKKDGKKDWNLINTILGEDLTRELFGTKDSSSGGLRHRLVHGEYFNNDDNGKDYLDLVHKRIMTYFNKFILKEELLHEDVTHPQRHFFGNKEECKVWVKGKEGTPTFKDILQDFNQNGFRNPKKYNFVFDDKLNTSY